jgi:hypothetical protein
MELESGVPATMTLTFASVSFKWELTLLGTTGKAVLNRFSQDGKYGYNLTVEGKEPKFMQFSGVDCEMAAFVQACNSGIEDGRISAAAAFNDVAVIQAMVDSSSANGRMTEVQSLLE